MLSRGAAFLCGRRVTSALPANLESGCPRSLEHCSCLAGVGGWASLCTPRERWQAPPRPRRSCRHMCAHTFTTQAAVLADTPTHQSHRAHAQTHTLARTHEYTHAQTHTFTRTYTRVHSCSDPHVHTYVHTSTLMLRPTHSQVHTHMSTLTLRPTRS